MQNERSGFSENIVFCQKESICLNKRCHLNSFALILLNYKYKKMFLVFRKQIAK